VDRDFTSFSFAVHQHSTVDVIERGDRQHRKICYSENETYCRHDNEISSVCRVPNPSLSWLRWPMTDSVKNPRFRQAVGHILRTKRHVCVYVTRVKRQDNEL
jgi:hypothetical protein